MASRDIFSKALPNIKLATRFDADGKEIQVWPIISLSYHNFLMNFLLSAMFQLN